MLIIYCPSLLNVLAQQVFVDLTSLCSPRVFVCFNWDLFQYLVMLFLTLTVPP